MIRFDKVLEDIRKEYEPKGYNISYAGGRKHRKVFISSGAERRMILLSSTENYDTGNIYNIKMQDVRRAVAELPIPAPKEKVVNKAEIASILAKNENLLVKLPKQTEEKQESKQEIKMNGSHITAQQEDPRCYKLAIYIAGKGVLCVNCNEEVQQRMGEGMRARPMLTADKKLILVFDKELGVAPTKTRGEKVLAYRFGRSEVPFQYSEMSMSAREFPNVYARVKGFSLVTDKPLSERFFSGIITRKETIGFDMAKGSELRLQLNAWLRNAKAEGYDPQVKIVGGEITIEVAEKVYKSI